METDIQADSVHEAKLPYTWLDGVDLKMIVERVGTPVFAYSEGQLIRNIGRVRSAAAAAGLGDRVDLFVPFFPNSNPHVIKVFQDLGVGVLVQLPSEYQLLRRFGFENFIVSPGHVSDDEMAYWAQTGCPTFLSSLDEVRFALNANATTISARIDSLDSGKPGLKLGELTQLADLLGEYGRELDCFEVYCGSGNSRDEMIKVIEVLFSIFSTHFPQTKSVNFAGGMGFRYDLWAEGEKHFDWTEYLRSLGEIAERVGIPKHVRFMFEPARDVLADIGALILSVERSVIHNPISNIVVTDGTRMLMPSAQLRDRHHHVVFLDADLAEIQSENGVSAAIRGRTILRHDYVLPGEYWVPDGVGADSYMAILDVGAYCATQHMEFLNVPPAAEVLVDDSGNPHLITARGDDFDKWRHVLPEMKALKS